VFKEYGSFADVEAALGSSIKRGNAAFAVIDNDHGSAKEETPMNVFALSYKARARGAYRHRQWRHQSRREVRH